jgi:hypothetical protein
MDRLQQGITYSRQAAARASIPTATRGAPLERASVVREGKSEKGETRLYSGSVADLDGDGTLELVAGGYSSEANGKRLTIVVYLQNGDGWVPLTR